MQLTINEIWAFGLSSVADLVDELRAMREDDK
jgi:hypothetical protein